MKEKATVLVAISENQEYALLEKSLKRVVMNNQIKRFADGGHLVEFLFTTERSPQAYVLIMDINITGFDATEILRKIKSDISLRNIPVILLAEESNKKEIEKCHDLGCSCCFIKPEDSDEFSEMIHNIGRFLLSTKIPKVNS